MFTTKLQNFVVNKNKVLLIATYLFSSVILFSWHVDLNWENFKLHHRMNLHHQTIPADNNTRNVSVNATHHVSLLVGNSQSVSKSNLSERAMPLNVSNKAAVIQRVKKKARESCKHVLLSSQGGVGSSGFMLLLHGLRVPVNCPGDGDGFKHKNADQFVHDEEGISLDWIGCAFRAMVIVGDPLHSIESVYRHFGVLHINKWRVHANKQPYRPGTRLSDIWAEIESAKEDTTGVSRYIDSWLRAINETNWPEIRVVTTETLYNNAVDNAKFLGVKETNLRSFEQLKYRPKPYKTSAPPAVQSIFEPINSRIKHLRWQSQ